MKCATFDNACLERDLQHIDEAFAAFEEGREGYFSPFGDEKYSMECHLYCCEEKWYTELIIPIYSGKYNNSVMGMLVMGQIFVEEGALELRRDSKYKDETPTDDERRKEIIETVVKKELREEEKCSGKKLIYKNVNEVYSKHGEAFGEFIRLMQEKAKLCEKEYLFELQAHLFKKYKDAFSEDANGDVKPIQATLEEIFKYVVSHFEINRCLVFFSDLTEDTNSEKLCKAMEIVEGAPKEDVEVDVRALNKDHKNNKVRHNELVTNGYLKGYTKPHGTTVNLYSERDENHFVGVLLEWDSKIAPGPGDDDTSDGEESACGSFIELLVTFCSAKITARIVQNIKENIDNFAFSALHDLAQKASVMTLQNNYFTDNIREAQKNGVLPGSAKATDIDKIEYHKNLFYQRCLAYNRQMKDCQETLEFLQKTLNRPTLTESPSPTNFPLVSRIFVNLKRHFNSPYVRFYYGRKLIVDHPEIFDHMFADPNFIDKALMNLLDNAYKYAYIGTYVYLLYEIDEINNNHVFRVMNFGCGISSDVKERIFEKGHHGSFYRDNQGAGLWNVRRFAEMHSGDVVLEDGIEGESERISDYNVEMMCLADLDFKFKEHEKDDGEEIISKLKGERSLLERDGTDIAYLPKAIDKLRYRDIVVLDKHQKNKQRHRFTTTIYSLKDMYDIPTYAVTFKMTIPIKYTADGKGDKGS